MANIIMLPSKLLLFLYLTLEQTINKHFCPPVMNFQVLKITPTDLQQRKFIPTEQFLTAF